MGREPRMFSGMCISYSIIDKYSSLGAVGKTGAGDEVTLF